MGLYHLMKRPFARFTRIGVVGLLAGALVLSGCGPADDDGEATVDAPETVEITEAAEPSPGALSTEESSSTPIPAADQGSERATPMNAPDEATPASPESQLDRAPVAGRQRPQQATDDASPPVRDSGPGDGTTGGATDEEVATPSDDASSDADGATVTVDSCEPEVVPEFDGDTDAYVVVDNLNFRTGPGVDCDPIGESVLESGTALTVTSEPVIREGEDTEWVRVEVEGQEGWVSADFIEPEAE